MFPPRKRSPALAEATHDVVQPVRLVQVGQLAALPGRHDLDLARALDVDAPPLARRADVEARAAVRQRLDVLDFDLDTAVDRRGVRLCHTCSDGPDVLKSDPVGSRRDRIIEYKNSRASFDPDPHGYTPGMYVAETPDQKRLSPNARYDEREGVGIWIVEDLAEALETGALDPAEEHYRDVAGDPAMDGVVVVLEDTDSVPPDVLGHVNDKWTELHEATHVKRSAYVGDGISRLAVASRRRPTTSPVRSATSRKPWAAEA